VLGADIPSRYGRPSRAVTYEKRERTLYAARSYLRSHPTEKRARMDVIEILFASAPKLSNTKEIVKINHITNAFGA
jgi:Holliday junction resolvase-like predicted endonuclease